MHIASPEPILQRLGSAGMHVLTRSPRQPQVRCTRLASLNLAENGIRDLGAQYLAEVLPQCVSLSHLNLPGNLIYDKDALALARALTTPLILIQQLNLSGNVIGARSAGSLASMLHHHDNTLLYLNL